MVLDSALGEWSHLALSFQEDLQRQGEGEAAAPLTTCPQLTFTAS